ncbi:MAG: efflux RND transporter permease subunit, partial [Robiginitomaculum sp.]|nr:efflux RND transporter permease subunit [Robiginitomaculum sp.]
RTSLETLQNMRVRTPDGAQVPFSTVANIRFEQGATSIKRLNRRRVVEVTGSIDRQKTNAQEVTRAVTKEVLPKLQEKYPDLEFVLEGDQKEIGKFITGLIIAGFTSLFGIYALIAIAFRSYLQPLLVMFAIPFGYIGAVMGHLIFGLPWSMFSFFGVVAAAGVVVNDNLVLIDYINVLREKGVKVKDAVTQAAASRFRPILLTTLTTFFGLMPITMQKSPQAQYLIPMAISLAFGVVLASIVTLLLIPAMYMWLDKLRGKSRKKSRGDVDVNTDASYAE